MEPLSSLSVSKEAGWVKARVISGRVCLFTLHLQAQGTCLGMRSGGAQLLRKRGPDGEDASPCDTILLFLSPTSVLGRSHTRPSSALSVF